MATFSKPQYDAMFKDTNGALMDDVTIKTVVAYGLAVNGMDATQKGMLTAFATILKANPPEFNGEDEDDGAAFAKFASIPLHKLTKAQREELEGLYKKQEHRQVNQKGSWIKNILDKWCATQDFVYANLQMIDKDGKSRLQDYKNPAKPDAAPYTYSGKGKCPAWLWTKPLPTHLTDEQRKKAADDAPSEDKRPNPAMLWDSDKNEYVNGTPIWNTTEARYTSPRG